MAKSSTQWQMPFSWIKEHRSATILIVSSVLGLFIGLSLSSLQHAVEQGQVIARLIPYPPENPFYVYQAKAWTFLAQFSAIGLRLGFSEVTLSLFFSGLAGMLTFSGLALWMFALSDDIFFSLLAPFLAIHIFNDLTGGFNYPLMPLGMKFTYGMIGMGFIIFVSGLFGIGQHRWGWLLAGFSLAVHPSLGVWLNIALWINWLFANFKQWRQHFFETVLFASIGYSFSAISFGIHWWNYRSPAIDIVNLSKYMEAYLLYWDDHRVPISFWGINVSTIGVGAFVSLVWVWFKRDALQAGATCLLRFYIITVVLGGGMATILYGNLPIKIPDVLWILMPSRFLNFPFTLYYIVALGLLWRRQDHLVLRAFTACVLFGLLLTIFVYDRSTWIWYFLCSQLIVMGFVLLVAESRRTSYIAYWIIFGGHFILVAHFLRSSSATIAAIPISSRTQAILIALVITAILFFVPSVAAKLSSQANKLTPTLVNLRESISSRLNVLPLWKTLSFLSLGAAFVITLPHADFVSIQKSFVADFYNHPLYVHASQGQGQLLTAVECHNGLMQLYTRRPILSNTPMNMLPYAIESAPEMARIMKDIYDLDFFSPPASATHTQTTWEARSTQEWKNLAEQYHFGDVYAPSPWKMQLPRIIFRDKNCTLYAAP